MKISEHADRTEKIIGIRAEDIHKWIDGFFDAESFGLFLRSGRFPGYDPYKHRKHRHCKEALKEALLEFHEKYTKEQIKGVFECHIKDDYNGYLPQREDFENGTFQEKYHENEEHSNKETILSRGELSEYFKGKNYSQNATISKKHSKGFRFRIVLPTILAILLFVSSVFVVVIPLFRKSIIDRKKEMESELTATAISVINYFIDLEKKNVLTRKSAQAKAISEIEKMRYGVDNKDYFWITDMHPRMIMHPYRADLIGQDLTDYKDIENKSGKKLFVEFVKLVKKNGHGYLEYLWQWMDDSSRTVPKISYVKGIPEWNWIIGTGVYINDVEHEISKLIHKLLIIFTSIAVCLSVILLYIVLQSHKIEENRLKAETGLREAKDRYRALVEASKEGYILKVGDENIYTNHALQQMLGYSEQELRKTEIWKFINTEDSQSSQVIEHLKNMASNTSTASKEFKTSIKRKNGEILNVFLTTANIFFAKKNGSIISIREITREKNFTNLESFKGLNANQSIQIAFTKVENVYQPFENIQQTENDEICINLNAPIFEAISKLKQSEQDKIIVQNSHKKPIGTISYEDIAIMNVGLPAKIIMEINQSENIGYVLIALNKLPILIREMSIQGSKPDSLRKIIGSVYNAATEKFIKLTIKELGKPPVDFAFISFGSNARYEMTMFSDQDNGLIFVDNPGSNYEEVNTYFAKLSEKVCAKLDQAGFPYCPGGIMASNSKWRLSVSEWEKCFANWILNTTQESIMEVSVFLDIHCVYGNKDIVEQMRKKVIELIHQNPQFLIHLAKSSLLYNAPLNLFGKIKSEKHDGIKIFNIKDSIRPIETFAKIYALKNKIPECNTLDRLEKIHEMKILQHETYNEMVYAFNYFWDLRFYNQLIRHFDLKQVEDNLDLEKLTNIERNNLKNVLSRISIFQTKLSYDFLGVALK